MINNKMCHLTVVMKSGESYQQRNLMVTDITINDSGVIVRTQLGITTYHAPNVEVTSIRYIEQP